MRSDLLGAAAAVMLAIGGLVLVMGAAIARLADGRRRSQRFLFRVSEAIDAHMYAGELHGGVYRETYTGPGFGRFVGPLPSGTAPFEAWLDAVHPDDVIAYLDATSEDVLRRGEPVEVEYRLRTPFGERWIWERQRPTLRPDGSMRIEGIVVDISDRREALQRLAVVENQLGEVLQFVDDGVFEAALPRDGAPQIRFMSDSMTELMGGPVPPGTDVLQAWGELVHAEDRERYEAYLGRLVAGRSDSAEYRIVGRDDRVRWVWTRVSARTEPDGTVVLAGVVSDVTERRAFLAELEAARHVAEQQARTDALTGLPNRRRFAELAEDCLAREPAAVLLVDVDHFKSVNDHFGHVAGDEVLTWVADRLRGAAPAGAAVARWGGEEFIVLLPGAFSPAGLNAAGDELRRVLSGHPIPTSSAALTITASVGAALATGSSARLDDLVASADRALYLAKSDGRDRTVVDDPAAPGALAEARDERAAVEAVIDGGLEIHTQPIVDLRTGQVVGYEALSRFPSTADPSPASWFARARRCGLSEQLEAAAILAALELPERPAGTYLSLNISPSLLLSSLLDDVLPGDLCGIVLEVTEHELVVGGDALQAVLTGLRERGARLAVDDAGAGYAGFTQLLRVQPDIVKLDRSMVDGVAGDGHRAALIEAFARFARRIGALVCAEGLETLDDLLAVADLDVACGQGYHLARPGAGWPQVDASVAVECARALAEVVRDESLWQRWDTATSERRLKHVAWRLANVTSLSDLPEVMPLVTAELAADWVLISAYDRRVGVVESLAGTSLAPTGDRYLLADYPETRRVVETLEAHQVLVSDPDAEPGEVAILREEGWGSLLMVPIVAAGEAIGLLEVHSREERPWSRSDLHRAHMIACQLAAVVRSLALARGDADEPFRRAA
jgi:diguanylate cyclase (GGDEF)-like protein